MAPSRSIEHFEQNYETTHRCYSDEKLFEEYLESQNWEDFKSKLTQFVLCEKNGVQLSTVPVTTKGSSGWASWPGIPLKTEKTTKGSKASKGRSASPQ